MDKNISDDNVYFLDKNYLCQPECIKTGFWTGRRIAREPHNGSHAVMAWIAEEEGKKEHSHATQTMLDVGCGPSSKILHFFSGYYITGLDMPEAVVLAKKNNPSGNYLTCDLDSDEEIAAVSRQIGLFDIVICIDVIEHVLYPEKMLRLIRKHLNPVGVAYIGTLERDISRGSESGKTGSPKLEHIREWNEEEFTKFLQSEGFIVHEVKLTPLSSKPTLREEHMRVQTLRCTVNPERNTPCPA